MILALKIVGALILGCSATVLVVAFAPLVLRFYVEVWRERWEAGRSAGRAARRWMQ